MILLLALVANVLTVLLWRYQITRQGNQRLVLILAAIACFVLSCWLFAIPYAWTRAPFIALGVLGLSGWLVVFVYPLFNKQSS